MDAVAYPALGREVRSIYRQTAGAYHGREAASESGYRACLGIIRLAKQYSATRMEAAAERALQTGACRLQSVDSILKNSLDRVPLAKAVEPAPPPDHDNIRGAEYFE